MITVRNQKRVEFFTTHKFQNRAQSSRTIPDPYVDVEMPLLLSSQKIEINLSDRRGIYQPQVNQRDKRYSTIQKRSAK